MSVSHKNVEENVRVKVNAGNVCLEISSNRISINNFQILCYFHFFLYQQKARCTPFTSRVLAVSVTCLLLLESYTHFTIKGILNCPYYIAILDIIYRPALYKKNMSSETGFSLCLQMEPTQMSPMPISCLCFRREQHPVLKTKTTRTIIYLSYKRRRILHGVMRN
jgi:hypothetical protein